MPRSRHWSEDTGTATLEFITAGMILLVPLVYLILTVAAIQGGALAVEGAASQAARVFVQAPTVPEAQERAARAVQFALEDYGLPAADATVSIECSPDPDACLTRLGRVTVTVGMSVALPLVPSVLSSDGPLAVPLRATATEQVSRFGLAP
jgi:hypothetical protein